MTSFIVVSFVWRPKKNELRRSENVELQVLHLSSFRRFLPYLSYMMMFPSPFFPWLLHDSFGQKKSSNLRGICIYLYISKPFLCQEINPAKWGHFRNGNILRMLLSNVYSKFFIKQGEVNTLHNQIHTMSYFCLIPQS